MNQRGLIWAGPTSPAMQVVGGLPGVNCLPGVTWNSNFYVHNQHSEEMSNIFSLLWNMLKSKTVKIRSVHKARILLNCHHGNCFGKESVTNIKLFCLTEVPVN